MTILTKYRRGDVVETKTGRVGKVGTISVKVSEGVKPSTEDLTISYQIVFRDTHGVHWGAWFSEGELKTPLASSAA